MVRFSVVVALDDGAEVVVDDDFIQIIQLLPVARVDVVGVPPEGSPAEVRRAFGQNPNKIDARDWKQLDDLNKVIVDNDLGAVIKGDYH